MRCSGLQKKERKKEREIQQREKDRIVMGY
jgi:hypothetical protein